MQHVRIRITAHGGESEVHPVYGLLANGDAVERATGLQWNYTGESLGMLHYVEGDADAFEAALQGVDLVLGYEIQRAGDGTFYAYVQGKATEGIDAMWRPVEDGGLIIVPPIVYHEDGSVSFSLYGPEHAHQDAFERAPDFLDVTIEAVGDLASTVGVETRLSDRQREAVETALELGYYETPREASQADVAAALGCAPSTAAEHLQKAESILVTSAIGEQ